MSYDKSSQYTPQNIPMKNPKWIIGYGANGKVRVKNPNYDPTCCEICGKKKGFFHRCQ
jgi:hypothetical protein